MNNSGRIVGAFDIYRRLIKNVWEEYLLLDFSLRELKESHRVNSIASRFKRELFFESRKLDYKDRDIHHFIDNLTRNKLASKALVEAVSITEKYLQDITSLVYLSYPGKLAGGKSSANDDSGLDVKLINLIIDSTSKEEILNKLIEEKIRGIFYGKPTDFFEKDKAKIGFKDFFNDKNQAILDVYAEVVARRNIVIHNNGRVDRKYMREVSGNSYTLNQKVSIDRDYIKHVAIVLRGVSALSTKIVLEKNYKADLTKNRISKITDTFLKYLEIQV